MEYNNDTTSSSPPAPGMVQCEITGQWLPEEETVVIQGFRVGAEGKAELLDKLEGGELLPGQLERPSVLRRWGALIVDSLIMYIPMGIAIGVLGVNAFQNPQGGRIEALQLILSVVLVAYFAVMHGRGGQSLGKMAAKIKVVMLDGGPISTTVAFWRAIYYLGPGIIGSVLALVAVISGTDVVAAVSLGVGVLAGVYGLANVIVALIDTDMQRAIHDRLAGTRVIALD